MRRSTTRVAATLAVGLGRLHKSDDCVIGAWVRPVTSLTGRTHPLLGGMNSEAGDRKSGMMGAPMPGPDNEMQVA